MAAKVSRDRWLQAQEAERGFWSGARNDDEILWRTMHRMAAFARWALAGVPALEQLCRSTPDCVEFGVGPIGMASVFLLPLAPSTNVIGVDPLPLAPPVPSAPLAAALAWCHDQFRYAHRVCPAERTDLEAGAFDIVAAFNMLDHCEDPGAVIAEAWRLLRPGGRLLVSCETFSRVERWRFRAITARRHPDSVLVRAHPFRFLAADIDALVAQRFAVEIRAVARMGGGDDYRLVARKATT